MDNGGVPDPEESPRPDPDRTDSESALSARPESPAGSESEQPDAPEAAPGPPDAPGEGDASDEHEEADTTEVPEPPEADSGRLIADRYRLRSRIGGGAMGAVWSGLDELLRRPVAVKEVRLPAGMSAAEADELRERTLREARAIATVAHPNVVTLYDVARDGDAPFVVMELVPSSSLATIVRERGPLDDRQLAVVAEAVASALAAAHSAGVVHRDVKPGNVLLADDGRIKLSDFGISRNLAEPTLTRSGIMLGTPAYIAPEVAAGEPLTTAADVWGLGATLFAACEGHPPYDTDDNPLATVTSVVRGPVPAPQRGGPIADLVTELMVKDPQQRLPLSEVLRRVHPLLPAPGERAFTPVTSSEPPSVSAAPEPAAPAPSTTRTHDERHEKQEEPEAAPLAADPGPLPFTPREPAPARRSPWRLAALVVGAVLVFVLAAGGGFTATRLVAGRSVLPQTPVTSTTPAPRPAPRLVPFVGNTEYPSSEGPGRFTMPAPRGWNRFEGFRKGPPTDSLTVHFVSPNGHVELAVQRFADFHDRGYTTQGYVNSLRRATTGPNGRFRLTRDSAVGGTGEAGRRDRELAYTTVTNGVLSTDAPPVRRRTVSRVMPRNGDLWVLRATAPPERFDRARDLFDRVLRGFKPLP